MLNNVSVVNSRGLQVDLSLHDVSDGFVVKGIDGLEPVKATVVSTTYALMDGARYQNARRDPRNIVLHIGFQPDYFTFDVSEIRNRLYTVLMPKSFVTLTFEDSDGTSKYIEGYVESFEAPYFTSDPGADISILCFDPDFLAADETTFNSPTYTGGTSVPELAIPYAGTVETGFKLTYYGVTGPAASFTADLRHGDGITRTLFYNKNVPAGAYIRINTQPGQKDAEQTLGSAITPVLQGISPQSEWLKLAPGSNFMRVNNPSATQFNWAVVYRERFGGL